MKYILGLLFGLTFSFHSFGIDYFKTALNKRTIAEYDSSIYYFNQALLNQNLSDTTKAYIIIERGKTQQLNHSYDLALIDFNKGVNSFQKKGNINGIALSYIYFAEFNRHLGRLNKAEIIIKKIEPLVEHNNVYPKTKALFYNRYAAIIAETNSKGADGIILYSNKAIEISKQYKYNDIEASSLNQLGYLYFHLKSNEAINYFLKALNLYEKLGDIRAQVNVIKNIARLQQIKQNYYEGIQICDKGLQLINDKNWYFDLKDLILIKMVCLYETNQFEAAYKTSRSYNEAYINFMNTQHTKSFQELETKYEVAKKDKKILLEQEKTRRLKQETEQKQKEIRSYILISILLSLILIIAISAYYKIRKSNKLLNQTIEQKEILLQEVHHRVKNNLTVLNSLLYIQADESSDKETKRILKECQGRIQSMALVHQNLYDVDDASEVNLNSFLEQLISESQEIFGIQNLKISKKIETNAIHFDMSFTVFLGLILNELITNSFKYAFSDVSENKMKIELKKEENEFVLTYSDSGHGLPKDFDLKKNSGFGFKLIKIMVNQIRGTLNYSKKNNSFTIQFKKT